MSGVQQGAESSVEVVQLVGLYGIGSGWAARFHVPVKGDPPLVWTGPTCEDRRQAERHATLLRAALTEARQQSEESGQPKEFCNAVRLACVGMVNDAHWPRAPESWRKTIWSMLVASSRGVIPADPRIHGAPSEEP